MPEISSFDRKQIMLCSWDDLVDPESVARLIDAFVNSLDLSKYGIEDAAIEGRPRYSPASLYKLYIYGSRKGIRSSRKLAESCRINVEAIWLMGGAQPDFRTISDFRTANYGSLKDIFHEFNRRISGAVEWGFSSVDGSKFQAWNSKDRNFTKNKLDDRIQWLDAHIDEYLRILVDEDEADDLAERSTNLTKEIVEKKLAEARARLARYEGYQKQMEEQGLSQLSLTDADSKLMKSKNGFIVAYNPQTVVDSETHLIRDFNMTNQVTDHGLLTDTMEYVRSESEGILELVADRGYENGEDMVRALENGIIPNVITEDGKDGYTLEVPFEEAECDASSVEPAEIRRCLHAGQIPEVYEDVISNMEIKEVRRKVKEDTVDTPQSVYGTMEEMVDRAKEGYFVRDPERNLVICPAGEILRQKSIKKNGYIRYCNKNACRHCKYRNRCYKGKNEWKEIDFTKDQLEKPCKEWLKAEGKPAGARNKGKPGSYIKMKVVRFFLKPDRAKTARRMCLSEHPFGTMKRAVGMTYFLLKGIPKVEGEFALFCLGYNIERARNLLGFHKLMELMEKA